MLNVIVHRIKNQIEFRKENYFLSLFLIIYVYWLIYLRCEMDNFKYKKKYPSYFQSALLLFV